MSFTLGADPELFVGRGGRFVSAHGLIPGTKDQPFPVHKGAVQVDGLALEFNIDPAANLPEFKTNLEVVAKQLRAMVPTYQFLKAVTVELTEKQLASIPEEALRIGCSSDLNAYTAEENEPKVATNLRAVGGHLHIGGFFTEGQGEMSRYVDSLRLVRLLDKYVGVYSLLWDGDQQRRKIYGSGGACRVKDYGVEYRSLSNRWLFNPRVIDFIYRQVGQAVAALKRDEDVDSLFYADIINKSSVEHEFFVKDPVAQQFKKGIKC